MPVIAITLLPGYGAETEARLVQRVALAARSVIAAPAAGTASETDAALAAGVGFQPEGERLTGDVGAHLTRGLQAQARKQHERRARKENEKTRKAEKEAARHVAGSSSANSSHAAPDHRQIDPSPAKIYLRPGQF